MMLKGKLGYVAMLARRALLDHNPYFPAASLNAFACPTQMAFFGESYAAIATSVHRPAQLMPGSGSRLDEFASTRRPMFCQSFMD